MPEFFLDSYGRRRFRYRVEDRYECHRCYSAKTEEPRFSNPHPVPIDPAPQPEPRTAKEEK